MRKIMAVLEIILLCTCLSSCAEKPLGVLSIADDAELVINMQG
ncbi:MAG: hypothetical protein ACI4P1_03080 [Erysipelotrichaceae bacterium]